MSEVQDLNSNNARLTNGRKRRGETIIPKFAQVRERGLDSDWKRFPKGRNIMEELPPEVVDFLFNKNLEHPNGVGFPTQDELIDKLSNNRYPSHLGEIDSIEPIVGFINEYVVVDGGEEM